MDDYNIQKKILPKPLSVDEQIINLREENNLIIEDEEYAKDVLSRISYFRLVKAYGLGLKPKNGKYSDGVSFKKIVNIYEFNSRLRRSIFPLIEDVEVNLRCKLANYISCKYGNLGFENPDNFQNKQIHIEMLDELELEINRAKSLFVTNFKQNYENGKIPFYAVIELFSFGMLSRFYSNMKVEDKKAIGKQFGVGYTYLESWLKSIVNVRNICAHYGRIYNVKLSIKPTLYRQYPSEYNYRIFGILIVLKYMVADTSLWLSFKNTLQAIIDEYSIFIDLKTIGFPENWLEILDDDK